MVLAAAFTVMERTQKLLVEAEREVKDFWAGERGDHIGVGLEVGVDIVQVMICLGGGVEGTPEEVEVRIKIFPVGEGEVLSTTEQISKMNVVIILLDMVK